MKVIITLGSNYNQEENIRKAKERLKELFPNICFSEQKWTEPIAIVSDRFLNCIATFETSYPQAIIERYFKQIEKELGDSHENHKNGLVRIDIDLIKYGNKTIRDIIWL